jgi:hypothetical protein
MDITKFETKELVQEISRRLNAADNVFRVLKSLTPDGNSGTKLPPASSKMSMTVQTAPKVPGVPESKKPAKPMTKRVLNSAVVYGVIKNSSKPLSVSGVHARLKKGTLGAVMSQINRLLEANRIKRVGNIKPFSYELV